MQQQTEALYLNNRERARLVLNSTNLLKVLHEKAILQIIYIQPEYVVKQ